jgi:DNA-binding NarL/FixJ family response regulator
VQRIIPVLLIEDSRLRRDVILSMLDGRPGVRVVAAESPDAALARLRDFNARVVLLSADLASAGSHLVVERVKSVAPDVRVVVLDVHAAREDIIDFVVAGASGFVVKDATPDDVVSTVVTVAEGGEVLPPSIAGPLFARLAQRPATQPSEQKGTYVQLTKREREVVQLIGEGLTNREIAARMNLSAFTVKSHVRNIMEKLSLHTRLQVAAYKHHADG